MKHPTQKDLKEIADKFGVDQFILIMREGGAYPHLTKKQIYTSFGLDKAPSWLSDLRMRIFEAIRLK